MSSGQVSIDGVTRALPAPFFVVATQNPLEFEGTYPLPESQLDRFLLRLRMGYPARADERELLRDRALGDPLEALQPVASLAELESWIADARAVRFDDALYEYVLDLIDATRVSRELACGASPRAALGLVRVAKAWAFLEGRDYAVPDDVKRSAVPCLAHRLVALDGDAAVLGDGATEGVVAGIVERIEVPL
jgi:MoxR-like ATPase